MESQYLVVLNEGASWFFAVGEQITGAILDPEEVTYLQDGFLAELIILGAAYFLGRMAQRNTDSKRAKRVMARDLVREFEELRRFQFRDRDERNQARIHGADILLGTVNSISERVGQSSKLEKTAGAFADALNDYKERWGSNVNIMQGEKDTWKNMAHQLRDVVKVLVGRNSASLLRRIERAQQLRDGEEQKPEDKPESAGA